MLLHLPPIFNLPSISRSFPCSNSQYFFLSVPSSCRRNPSQQRFRCSKVPPESAAIVDSFTKYSGYLFEGGAAEAESLEEYNPSKIASIYLSKPLLVLRRLLQIGTTFGRWFGLRYLDNVLERSDQMFEIRAAELRAILVELGPAYVKIAQAVSSRPDVIPPAYLAELSLLQDRISPFATEIAFKTIEQELGLPIDMLYSEISSEPIAAASLGQVYQARLIGSGQLVAVKVQRPGVQAAISLDVFILRYLGGLVRRVAKLNTDLQAVVDEWASSLFRMTEQYTISRKRHGPLIDSVSMSLASCLAIFEPPLDALCMISSCTIKLEELHDYMGDGTPLCCLVTAFFYFVNLLLVGICICSETGSVGDAVAVPTLILKAHFRFFAKL